MTPVGTMARLQGCRVAIMEVAGGDSQIKYRSFAAEGVARYIAAGALESLSGVPKIWAVFIERVDGSWETVGTSYDVVRKETA